LDPRRYRQAAAVLLLATPRARPRTAFRPGVLASGAFGYGGSVMLQNAGPVQAAGGLTIIAGIAVMVRRLPQLTTGRRRLAPVQLPERRL
jgi:hypothetical protein